MEYRTLENTDSVCIYEAFTQAFSDYQVSVDTVSYTHLRI